MNRVQKFDFESHAVKSVGWDRVDVGELNYARRATFQDCEEDYKNPEIKKAAFWCNRRYGFEDRFLKVCVIREFVGSGFVIKKDLIELSLFY